MLYAGSSDGALYAVDARTGEIKWRFVTEDAVLTAPVAQDTLLFFAGGGAFYAAGRTAGQLVWKFDGCGTVECKPCIAGDRIIFGSWDGKVRALDIATGNQLWIWTRQANFYYAPAACWPVASADKLFVSDPERYVSAINLTTAEPSGRQKIRRSYDSDRHLRGGSRIYVRALDGSLYAYSTAAAARRKSGNPTSLRLGFHPSMPIEKAGVVYSGQKGLCRRQRTGQPAASTGSTGRPPRTHHGHTHRPEPRPGLLADGVVIYTKGIRRPASRTRARTCCPKRAGSSPLSPTLQQLCERRLRPRQPAAGRHHHL